MNKRISRYIYILLAVVIAFTMIIIGENYILHSDTRLEKDAIDRILNKLETNEAAFERIVNDTQNFGLEKIFAFDQSVNKRLDKDKFYLMVYSGDSLIYWSDNHVSVDSCLGDIKTGNSIMLTRNGYFQIYKKAGYYNYLCLYQIKSEYHVQNKYLNNRLNPDFEIDADVNINLSPQEGFDDIKDNKGNYLFSIKIINTEKIYPGYLKILELFLFLFIIILFEIFASSARKHRDLGLLILGSILYIVLIRVVPIVYHLPKFIYEFDLFNPINYANNKFFGSLGDYMLNVMVICRILYIIFIYIRENHIRSHNQNYIKIIHYIIKITTLAITARGIQSLITDSNISLDLEKYNLTGNSILLLLAITFTLINYILISEGIQLMQSSNKKQNIQIGLMHVLGWMVLFMITEFNPWSASIMIFYVWANDWLHQTGRFKNSLKKSFILPMLSAVFIGILVQQENLKKEDEVKKLYAQSISGSTDYKVEQLLPEIDKKIKNDIKVNEYIHSHELLTKYLKNRYFSGYMNRYHVNLIVLDSGDTRENAQNIDSLYNHQTFQINQTNFIKTSILSSILGYIGKYQINDFHRLYIILQSKPFETENGLNEVLSEVNYTRKNEDELYSWAIYKNGQLFNTHGVYNYPVSFEAMNKEFKQGLNLKTEEWNHTLFLENNGIKIIISKAAESWYQLFSYIAFFITYFIIFFILVMLLNLMIIYMKYIKYLIKDRKKYNLIILQDLKNDYISGGLNLSLMSTRIQLTVGAVILTTLAVTMFVNQNNITQLYNKNQIEKLTLKLKDVKSEVENSIPLNEGYIQTDFLEEQINPISEIYQTDLNIFDPAGNLLYSTQPRIFESGIISSKINQQALKSMLIDGKSQMIQNEKLGKLEYLSAYIPLKISDRQMGYLNLPYFTKQAELSEAIKTNLLSLITPYAFIFIILGILSWLITSSFVSRLNFIREKISTTTLDKKNPKIKWHTRDEIGELVKQYNNMVDKLAQSAENLAKNERNEAWREMAKQIAHEIKNPLTPMKLNLQQLQRAYKDNHPQKEEILNRVSRVLVEQIDALATLADEFSNFAQMPESRNEIFNICSLLEDIKTLFDEEPNTTITFHKPADDIYIFADKLEMKRVFTNLIKNSIQAIPEDRKGEISVDTYSNFENRTILISVKDNGTGITDELKDKIFVPNFSTKNSGMGLGLAMVKKIIENCGGKISFQSEPGNGTTFFIELPMTK